MTWKLVTWSLFTHVNLEYLDKFSSENIEVTDIVGTMGGFTIFYKEETENSKYNRLGKKLESIFD